jgi:hypothetical protein
MQQVRFIREAQDKSALEAWRESLAQQTQQNPNL